MRTSTTKAVKILSIKEHRGNLGSGPKAIRCWRLALSQDLGSTWSYRATAYCPSWTHTASEPFRARFVAENKSRSVGARLNLTTCAR